MLKKDLRKHILEKRSNALQSDLTDSSLHIANKALALPIWEKAFYHIYLHSQLKKEVDTQPLISLLQGKDKEIVVPRIIGPNQLEHVLLTDNTLLRPNSWGIPEPVNGIPISPSKLDVVFIPLLAFDLKGNRVGYGKGYYDGFLAQCRTDCLKIGVSLFEAVEKISDVGEHDVSLDLCLTPERVYRF